MTMTRIFLCFTAGTLSHAAAVSGQQIIPIDPPAGMQFSFGRPLALSADGSTLAGTLAGAGFERAFRLPKGGAWELLPPLAGDTHTRAGAVSADGSFVAGGSGGGAITRAVRWDQTGNVQELTSFPPGSYAMAAGISADGSEIVGANGDILIYPFHWISGVATYQLASLPPFPFNAATGISADATTIIGSADHDPATIPPQEYGSAVRWVPPASAPQPLGGLPGSHLCWAAAVNHDGTVITGACRPSFAGNIAFRWTQAGGVVALPPLQGFVDFRPTAISPDGNTIVGTASTLDFPVVYRIFIWRPEFGARELGEYLASKGVNLDGWTFTHDCSISGDADAQTFAGLGTHNGQQRGFWISLPALCYANCDHSTMPPILNVADFACFLQKFAAQDPYANCDNSTEPPLLNVADFGCFLQKFAAGCP